MYQAAQVNRSAETVQRRGKDTAKDTQFLSSLVHARVWSLACHVLCCALRGVTRLIDHCCACLAAGVHSGVRFCAGGRCAETPHTGLSQRAFPKGESPPIVSPHYGPPLPHPLCTTRLDPEPLLSSSSSKNSPVSQRALVSVPLE